MIDVKTTDPTQPRQKRPMRIVAAGILAAAAAVVAVTFVVIRDADDVTPTDEPSPTVTVPSTTPPRALLPNSSGERRQLAPGTYFIDEVDGTPTARISFTIGARWEASCPDGCLFQEERGRVEFSRPDRVFSDPCHWSDGYYPGPVTTLDGFVAALSEQGGWADVTTPSDISVDGYPGKALQRTLPAEILDCDSVPGSSHIPDGLGDHAFRIWDSGPMYEPGEVVTLWVLDIDGTVVVIHTVLFPSVTTGVTAMEGPSEAARADFAAVLASIRIERG